MALIGPDKLKLELRTFASIIDAAKRSMYDWRKMTQPERERVLEMRRASQLPWHSPPHWKHAGENAYLISAACYEHAAVIGTTPERMTECESEVSRVCSGFCSAINAWCILPNHYHVLVRTKRIVELLDELGQFHGRSAFAWNGQDGRRGRKVWYNCFERRMRSERHFWATLNYVHNNAVHHGYVKRWEDWPWSSAAEFLRQVGREKAMEIWRKYPVLDYGKKWDT